MEEHRTALSASTGSLSCTLLDRRSSVPLFGARITCVGRDNRIMRFDADRSGRFTTSLPQGVYDLVVSARGYLSLLVRGVGVLADHHQALTRALVPGEGEDGERDVATAVGGYVTDRLGRAVGNVMMQLGALDAGASYMTRTDRDGAYLLNGVRPAAYDLTVTAHERRLMRERVPIADAKAFVRVDLRIQG